MEFFHIHPDDNVQVSLENGHKYACRKIRVGEKIIKYGFPIGLATEDIEEGALVHSHNLKTALLGEIEYSYTPSDTFPIQSAKEIPKIFAYRRRNGQIGIRNELWIVPTVGCVNAIAKKLSEKTGAFYFPHPYGCSQLGGDQIRTLQILSGLIKHPNAGGVLVLGLGCENCNIGELKKYLGDYDENRIFFLNTQSVEDEITEGIRLIHELKRRAEGDKKSLIPISELKIGLKCGGSDGYSGITANPLVGEVTNRLTAMGSCMVLTEVPEMFGAEQILMNRCVSEKVFQKTVHLINSFKQYFINHGQPIGENPSPGNKEGGITTLEEKSLGCVQKGGKAPVTDVLDYGEIAKKPGLTLLNGPGNDMVAVTNLAAAGCHLILFTTGRGTPLGAAVPTIKIASNTVLAKKKKEWIDFDAMQALKDGKADEKLFELIIHTANGDLTKNEGNGYRDIAIFKDGVTL